MSVRANAVVPPEEELDDPSGLVGRTLADRYEVTGLLGVGGIGRVYRARHTVLKREVALKVLLEHYQCVPELQRRFEREAMALGALSHPNIVTITDFVSMRDATFLVMELVEGRDLDEILDEEGALSPADAFVVMEQLLSCLAYAHQHDVIHRDLKPQNVLVQQLPGGRLHPVVLDFGLAKFMDGTGPGGSLTKTGLIVGTPAYMAPEQASGAHADRRADVYAAGLMLFEMLAGVHPFEGYEGQELLRQHLLTPPPTLAETCPEAKVSPELEAFLARALAKDGADRFADGAAMLDAFLALPARSFVRGAQASPERRMRSEGPTTIAIPRASVSPSAAKRGTGRRWWLAVTLLGLAVVAAAALYFAWSNAAASVASSLSVGTQARGAAAAPSGEPPESTAEEPTITERAGDESAAAEANSDPEATDADEADVDEADADEADVDEADVDEADADEADVEESALAEVVGEEDDPIDQAPLPSPRDRPAARNPWRGATPSALAAVRRRLDRGTPITRAHIRSVQRYRQRNPRDVRANLTLGRMSASKGWLSAALIHYRRAYVRDPSSRGDPHMLSDLIRMVSSDGLHREGTEALVEFYGAEAIPRVRRAASRARDAETRARLNAALERLGG